MKSLRVALITFFLFFHCVIIASSNTDSDQIAVKASLDSAFITIGEPVTYTVTIKHTPDIKVLTRIPPPDDDIFKINKVTDINREENGMTVEGRSMNLTTYRLGEFILSPIDIEYRDSSGEIKTIKSDKIFLTVKSVAEGDAMTDIRGIKSVITLEGRLPRYLIFFGILLLFIIIGIMIYRKFRKKDTFVEEPETLLSPEEEAIHNLNQLYEGELLRKGLVKDYFLRFSEILKIYFEKRYEILAIESTTFEIMRMLRTQNCSSALLEKISEVMESADLAKFAKWKPEPMEIRNLNQKAIQIIEETQTERGNKWNSDIPSSSSLS